MLEEVRITGLGVIDDAVLELSQGFTVVTGETGAGKTMVVTGVLPSACFPTSPMIWLPCTTRPTSSNCSSRAGSVKR